MNPVTAPVVRHRNIVVRILRIQCLEAFIQNPPAGHHLTLPRRQRTQPAFARPGAKIGFGFGGRNLADRAFHPNLPLQFQPQEQQGGVRAGGQLLALVATVVGVEHEAVGVAFLEQHRSRVGPAGSVGGGERHGVGFGQLRGDCLPQPALKLLERIGIDVGLVQGSPGVFLTKFGEGLAHGDCGFLGLTVADRLIITLSLPLFWPIK